MQRESIGRVDACPACGAGDGSVCEEVPIEELARVWSRLEPGAGEELLNLLARGEIPAVVRIACCGRCDLEYGSPRFSVGSEWYARFERYGVRWEYGEVLQRLGGRRASILEIGCGDGQFLEMAERAGHSATGIDFNVSAVARARKRGLDARVADLRELQNESATFPVIVAFHVIEHIEEPAAFLSDVGRLADDGASLFLSCPGPRRFTTHVLPHERAGKRDVWDYPPFHQTRWDRQALSLVLNRSGWTLLDVRDEPLSWLGLNALLRGTERRFQSAGRLERKVRLAVGLFTSLLPSLRYQGMGILASARRA